MSLNKIIAGSAGIVSTAVVCAAYGASEANGTPLPMGEYLMPSIMAGSLVVGSEIDLPNQGPSIEYGGFFMIGMTMLATTSFIAGYVVNRL